MKRIILNLAVLQLTIAQCGSCSTSCGWTGCENACNPGYIKESGFLGYKSCNACQNPCGNCSGSKTTCTSCDNGYYLVGNTCPSCSSPCTTCVTNSNNCTGCGSGMTLSGSTCICSDPSKYYDGSSCQPCTPPCAQCTGSATTCTVCKDSGNMTLSSNSCSCTNSNYYFNSSSQTCKPCNSPCATCTGSATTCTACKDSGNMTLSSSSCSCTNSNYYFDNSSQICKACTPPCASCAVSPIFCNACMDASNMNLASSTCTCKLSNQFFDGSACTNCSSNCATCYTIATQCTSCSDGKYINGTTCLSCTSPCSKCILSASNCTQCVDSGNMTLVSGVCNCTNSSEYFNGTICAPCTSPCASCSGSPTNCTSCINGTYLSGSTCNSCTAPCANCNSPTSCISCSEPSNMDLTGDVCSCKSGRYWTGSTCTTCTSPCATCVTADTQCTGCIQGNYLSGTTCPACTAPCATCSTIDTSCDTCMDASNMTLTSHACTCTTTSNFFNGTICTPCTSPCATCETSATHCTSCVDATYQTINASFECVCPDGRYFDGTDCKLCTAPCATCETSNTHCLTCTDAVNQYINVSFQCICTDTTKFFNGTICEPCTRPCDSCVTTSINCTSCVDILQSPSTCACPDTYYLNSTQQCSPCVSPCVNCLSPTQCLTCIENQYIHGYDCLNCTEPCYNCEFSNDHCVDCLDLFMEITEDFECKCRKGYYQVGFQCLMCEAPCFECETYGNQCLNCLSNTQHAENYICMCNDGYYPYQNECSPCTLPCTTCITTSINCLSCLDPNHLLINGECICKYGYITNPSNSTVCAECQYPCADCIQSASNCTRCMGLFQLKNGQCECEEGYYNQNGQCFKCHQKCKTCLTYDQCLECSDLHASLLNQCLCPINYLSLPEKCIECDTPCYSCKSQTNLCLSCRDMHQYTDNWSCKCEDGYYMINNVCDSCLPNCLQCENKIECLTCQDTYYININKTCSECKHPCANCLSDTSCLSCQIRFRLVQDYCVPCPEVCLICLEDGLCNECIDGYYVSNQNCYQCSSNCKTCSVNSVNCTTCNDPNEIVNLQGRCECKNRYFYENGKCSKCQDLCEQCDEYDKCLECYSISKIELVDNKCQCQSGYYYFNNQCLICDGVCLECANSSSNCTKCSDDRQLKNKTCVCAEDYYSDNLNRCEPCNTEVGRLVKECNYANCTDNIWTWGEECDDGNTTPRDGCTNCKLDGSFLCWGQIGERQKCTMCPNYCKQCKIQDVTFDSLICLDCYEGYFLNDLGNCFACHETCKTCTGFPKNCLSCKYIKIDGKCSLCEDKVGYITDNTTETCFAECGDGIATELEECDDGNKINGDGCSSLCKIEKGFECSQDVCEKIKYLEAFLYAEPGQPYNNIRNFVLTFNNLLQVGTLEKDLIFGINKNSTYISTYDEISRKEVDNYYNLTIYISLSFNQSCIDGILTVEFDQTIYSIHNKSLEYNKITSQFDNYYFVDSSTVQTTQSTISTNMSILIFLAILVGIGLLFGGLDVFYNLLDTLQLISYLQYINTLLPYNLSEFLNLFSFAQIRFLENYIDLEQFIIQLVPEDYLNSTPEKLKEDNVTPLFYLNSVSILSVWISFAGLYYSSFLIPMLLKHVIIDVNDKEKGTQHTYIIKLKLGILFVKIYILKINEAIQNCFMYSGLLRTHISTAYDYSFAIIANIYSLDLNSSNTFVKISSYTVIVALIIYLISIYATVHCCKYNSFSKNKYIEDRFGAAFEGVRNQGFCKYYIPFCLVKKFLFMGSLIICYHTPVHQIMNIALLSIINITYLIILEPLEDENEYRKQISCEICMCITVFNLLLLVLMDEYKLLIVNSIYIGWICIISISTILILQLLIDAKQQWSFLYKKYKSIRSIFQRYFSPQHQSNIQQDPPLKRSMQTHNFF